MSFTAYQAQTIAHQMTAAQPVITDATPRVVTGVLASGQQFIRAFPNAATMDGWLASTSIAEISSVR